MTLGQFCDVLKRVTDQVHHFESMGDTAGEHIVWQETSGRGIYGGNRRKGAVRIIQVDLYTKDGSGALLEKLLEALDVDEIAFSEPVTTYEKETEYIRYIVECEVV